MRRHLVLTVAVLALMASAASADVYSPHVDRRQAIQHHRIEHGVANGSITPREERLLMREQGRIGRAESRMESDGRLSMRERARLDRMQDRAGRHIYRAKHNWRTAHSH